MVTLYKLLAAHGQRIALGVGVAISAIFLVTVFVGLEEFNGLTKEESFGTHIFDAGLMGAIILTVVAVVVSVFFSIYQVATHFRQSIRGILGAGALFAIFLIMYATASGEATGAVATSMERIGGITPGILRFVQASSSFTMILIVATFAVLLLAEIRNAFK